MHRRRASTAADGIVGDFVPADGTFHGNYPPGIPSWYNIYTMEFEFDPAKSEANKKKHGIHFTDAQTLWDDPDLVEVPARTTGEKRFLVVAKILGKPWSAIITWRRSRICIISVRRSRQEEIKIYES